MSSIVFGTRGGPAGAASARVIGNIHDLLWLLLSSLLPDISLHKPPKL